MSQLKTKKPKGLRAFDSPEFVSAFLKYTRTPENYWEVTTEQFQTLDADKLRGYKFDTLEDILFFNRDVLQELGDRHARGYTDVPNGFISQQAPPETSDELRRLFKLFDKVWRL